MGPRFLSRAWRRRLALGLPTILGLSPRGWFLPHRYAAGLAAPAGYAALLPLFQAAEPAFRAHLALLADHAADFERIAAGPTGPVDRTTPVRAPCARVFALWRGAAWGGA